MLAGLVILLGLLTISTQATNVHSEHFKNPIFKYLDKHAAPSPLGSNEYFLDTLMSHVKKIQKTKTNYSRLLPTEPPSMSTIAVDNSFIKLIGPNYLFTNKTRSNNKNTASIFFDFIDKRTKMNRLFEIINKTDNLTSTTFLKTGRIIDGSSASKRAGQFMLRDKFLFKNPIQMVVPLNSPSIEITRTRLSKPGQDNTASVFIQDKNPMQIPLNQMNRLDRILVNTVPNSDASYDVLSVWQTYLSPEICQNHPIGTKIVYPLNSRKFLVCHASDSYELLECPSDLIFDEASGRCQFF